MNDDSTPMVELATSEGTRAAILQHHVDKLQRQLDEARARPSLADVVALLKPGMTLTIQYENPNQPACRGCCD